MSENKTSSVPIWVWLIGGCALLSLLLVCVAGVIAFARGFLFVSSTSVSGPPAVVTVAVVTIVPESGLPEGNENPTDLPTATETLPQTVTPVSEAPTETAGAASDDPFAGVRDEIEANVIEIRGLPPLEDVEATALTTEELRARLEADFMEDYSLEESRLDVLTLSAFDLLERDFDFYNFFLDLYTEQIAGLYDQETNEFFIISFGEAYFGVLEQFTYAHEYVHALQDQHFNLDILADESLESEAVLAIQALAEGDATLAQTLYVTEGYFTQEQLLEFLAEAGSVDTTVLDSAPPFLARQLEFPYVTGLEFVQALYTQGGYSAVDAAWENLPQSTEQIIHPERYLSGDEPQIVNLQPLTETLGLGWQRLDEDTLGEFYLREYLVQQLDAGVVDSAATGWGGDRYTVYWNEETEEIVMVLKLVWDTIADGEEFFAAYGDYPANLFGMAAAAQPDDGLCWQGTDVICLYQVGEVTMIVRAPDVETAAAVAAVQE